MGRTLVFGVRDGLRCQNMRRVSWRWSKIKSEDSGFFPYEGFAGGPAVVAQHPDDVRTRGGIVTNPTIKGVF